MKPTHSRLHFLSLALPAALLLAATSSLSSAERSPTRGPAARKSGATESVRSGTVTAPDGQTAVTSIDRKWDEKSGTGTLNEAAATPDGRVSSREANLTRNSDGTITARGTFTDFDGRSFNYTETAASAAPGAAVRGRMVDEDGKVFTYETTTARAPDRQTRRTTVITRADGTKETRIEILDRPKIVAGL